MSRAIICLFLCVSLVPGFSQPLTFNKSLVFNDSLVDESAFHILQSDSGYLLSGESDYARHSLVLAGINDTGEFLWKKIYGDSRFHFRPGYFDAMIKTGDGNFAIAVSRLDSLVIPAVWSMFIIKFDPEGDTLWSRLVYKPDNNNISAYAHGLIETNDKGFLVYGEQEYKGVLVKTDSLGNREWLKFYGPNAYADYRYIFSACQTRDSGFIVGCHRENIGNHISGNPFIVCYDKSGNLKWEKGFGGEYKDYMGMYIRPINDSLYKAVTNYTVNTSGPPYYQPEMIQLQVITISDRGNVYSNLLTGDVDLNMTVEHLVKLADGTFLASGSTWDMKCWSMNLSANDNSLYIRMLDIPSQKDYISNLRDVLGCSDGGLLACGDFNILSAAGHYIPWLIKTDRYGCLDMGCDSSGIYITGQPTPQITCKYDESLIHTGIYNAADDIDCTWQLFRDGTWQNITDEAAYQGIHSDSLVILPGFIESNSESYRCHIFNQTWSIFSDSVWVDFMDSVIIVSQPGNQSAPFSGPAQFIIQATGGPSSSYQWYHGSLLLEGMTDSILTIGSVGLADTGLYHCVVTNACGPVSGNEASLTISDLGMDEYDPDSGITIRPNPTGSLLYVVPTQGTLIESVELSDQNGKILINEENIEMDPAGYCLDLHPLPAGLYILFVRTENKMVARKIIKM